MGDRLAPESLALVWVEDEGREVRRINAQFLQLDSGKAHQATNPRHPIQQLRWHSELRLRVASLVALQTSALTYGIGKLEQCGHGSTESPKRRLGWHALHHVDDALKEESAALPNAIEDSEVSAFRHHVGDKYVLGRILRSSTSAIADRAESLTHGSGQRRFSAVALDDTQVHKYFQTQAVALHTWLGEKACKRSSSLDGMQGTQQSEQIRMLVSDRANLKHGRFNLQR